MINFEEMIQLALDEEPVAQSVNSIISQLDHLMARAVNPSTVHEIAAEAIGIGQIRSRAELILSFLEARKTPNLKVVKHV
jgi:hypothetical protein